MSVGRNKIPVRIFCQIKTKNNLEEEGYDSKLKCLLIGYCVLLNRWLAILEFGLYFVHFLCLFVSFVNSYSFFPAAVLLHQVMTHLLAFPPSVNCRPRMFSRLVHLVTEPGQPLGAILQAAGFKAYSRYSPGPWTVGLASRAGMSFCIQPDLGGLSSPHFPLWRFCGSKKET